MDIASVVVDCGATGCCAVVVVLEGESVDVVAVVVFVCDVVEDVVAAVVGVVVVDGGIVVVSVELPASNTIWQVLHDTGHLYDI